MPAPATTWAEKIFQTSSSLKLKPASAKETCESSWIDHQTVVETNLNKHSEWNVIYGLEKIHSEQPLIVRCNKDIPELPFPPPLPSNDTNGGHTCYNCGYKLESSMTLIHLKLSSLHNETKNNSNRFKQNQTEKSLQVKYVKSLLKSISSRIVYSFEHSKYSGAQIWWAMFARQSHWVSF